MKYLKTYESKSTEHPFIQAAKRGSNSVIVKYIKNKQDLNIKSDIDNRTALMNAALNCFLMIVNELIQAGADVNLQDKDGRTALMMASTNKIVDALLSAGANINALNKYGQTLIFENLGYYSNSDNLIMYLEKFLAKGLDLDIKDIYDRNFYDYLKYKFIKDNFNIDRKREYYTKIEQYMNIKFPKYKEEWEFKQDIQKFNL